MGASNFYYWLDYLGSIYPVFNTYFTDKNVLKARVGPFTFNRFNLNGNKHMIL